MFCRERVARLGEHLPAIEQRGASLHAVGNGTVPMVRDFIEQFAPAFPVWTDPGRESYSLAGFQRSFGLGFDSFARGKRAMAAGHRQGKTQGDPWQQGGTLVVDQDGTVLFHHAADGAGDHAPVDALLAALDARGRRGGSAPTVGLERWRVSRLGPIAALSCSVALLGCPTEPLVDDDDSTADDALRVDQPLICDAIEPTLTADPDGGFRVETSHYRLFVRGLPDAEARELGRLAETAWEGWQAYFPTPFDLDPSDPFEAYVEANAADFADRLAADGLDPSAADGAGGFYHPATRRAYLSVQPSVWYTRVLFLHELAHQAHRQSRGPTEVQGWYVEGVAEFLSRHDWDGQCLRLGALPHLSLEDPARAALDALPGVPVAGWFDGEWPGRPLAMELLRMGEVEPDLSEAWGRLRARLDADGPLDAAGAASVLGLDVEVLEERLAAFVPRDQEPMEVVYTNWLHRTPTSVHGWADGVITVSRHKEPLGSLSFTSEPPSGGAVGLLLAWDSGQDWSALVLEETGELWTFDAVGGSNTWNAAGAVDPPAGPVRWSLAHEGTEAVVGIDGATVRVPILASPATGLAVEDDDVVFTELSWSP